MSTNPAAAVRGPRHVVAKGKTPVLSPEETRELLDSIPSETITGLRDRALIGLLVYTFARIGAAVAMNVEDIYSQNRRLWLRLHEKGSKQHIMPAHHNLEAYLHDHRARTRPGPSRKAPSAQERLGHGAAPGQAGGS